MTHAGGERTATVIFRRIRNSTALRRAWNGDADGFTIEVKEVEQEKDKRVGIAGIGRGLNDAE